MRIPIRHHQNFWAGVMFVVVGIGFAVGATQYHFGNSARPGPGYFPLGLGLLLALLGSGVLLQSLGRPGFDEEGQPDVHAVGPWAWKPLLIVSGAVAVFGALLPHAGLLVTLPVLVILVSTADHDFRWRSVLASALVLTLASYLIFVLGLKLSIPVWPSIVAGGA